MYVVGDALCVGIPIPSKRNKDDDGVMRWKNGDMMMMMMGFATDL